MQTVETVEAIGVEAPLAEPFGYAQGWVESRTATLVRVTADDGTVGWGECWGPVAGTAETVETVLAPVVEGEPVEPERLYDRLYDAGRATYQAVVPLPAIAGIEVALWDLRGKLTGQPLAAMLGGARRERVRPYATGHYFPRADDLETVYETITEEAVANADAVGAIKLKVGLSLLGHGPEADVELVRRVREAVGPETTVAVDANYAYDRPTARRVGEALADLDVRWFEEPVPPEDHAGYRALSSALPVPVAGGECHAPHEFDRLLGDGFDVAQPDVCIVGGLTPARRIADRAREAGVPVYPHVWGTPVALAASLGLIASLHGDSLLEFDRSPNPLREDLVADPVRVEDDHVPVPDGPGLGVDLDPEGIERYRVDR